MGLIDQAKADMQQITSNLDGFGVSMSLLHPDGSTIDIVGLHTKHHTSIDTDGNPINAKNAHIGFSEGLLIGYDIRDSNGEVNLYGHVVTVNDSTGTPKSYKIREWYPDETVGYISCILGDYVNLTSNTYVVDGYVENYFV